MDLSLTRASQQQQQLLAVAVMRIHVHVPNWFRIQAVQVLVELELDHFFALRPAGAKAFD